MDRGGIRRAARGLLAMAAAAGSLLAAERVLHSWPEPRAAAEGIDPWVWALVAVACLLLRAALPPGPDLRKGRSPR